MSNTAERTGNVVRNPNNYDIQSEKVEFESCGALLRGLLLTPKGVAGPLPAICMAPGMSGVKEGTILTYAEFFARGGFAVLAYDNLNFGDSGGEPRQEADPILQRRGYRDAVTFAGLRPEIDKDRIGIFGSSYAGGHVLEVAAYDRRVKCVVSQIPTINGFESFLRRQGHAQRLTSLERQAEDREARFQGKAPMTIKAVTDDPLEASAMQGRAAYDYFMEQGRIAPNWKNEVTLRSSELSRGLMTGAFTPYISPTPLMMIVALNDEISPADIALAAFAGAHEPKKLVLLPGGHFTPYVDEFALTSNESRDWFTRHLMVGGSVAVN